MREIRFRFIGMIFYIIFLTNLLLSQTCIDIILGIENKDESNQILVTLIGLGVLLFTSEAVGFLFSNISFFLWNIRGGIKPSDGGYSQEWNKLSYNFKKLVIYYYRNTQIENDAEKVNSEYDKKLSQYSKDVFLSYFWQRAPKVIIEWVVRRHSAFFTNRSAIVAILLALLLSSLIIFIFGFNWNIANTIVTIICLSLISILWYNAIGSRKEGWQMIDLWLNAKLNTKMNKAISEIDKIFLSSQIK